MLNFQNKKVMLAVVIATLLVLGGVTYWYFSRSGARVSPELQSISPQPVQPLPENITPSPETSTPVSQ